MINFLVKSLTSPYTLFLTAKTSGWQVSLAFKKFFKESFYSTEQGEEGTRSARKDYNPWLHHSFEPLLDNKSEEQGYVLKTVIKQTKDSESSIIFSPD